MRGKKKIYIYTITQVIIKNIQFFKQKMDFVKVLWRLVKGNNDCLEEKKTVEYRV